MSKIVVAKLIRLGKDGDKYKKDIHAHIMRTSAKVEVSYIEEFNKRWETSGQLYIVDKELTAKRDEEIEPKPKKQGRPPVKKED